MPLNDLWKRELHQQGFMGFVDGFWLFFQRLGIILMILAIICLLVVSIYAGINGKNNGRNGGLGRYRNSFVHV